MQYSPKLKRAIQEIKDILSREDIAGVVIVHEPGFSEFLVKVDPTYSCAKIQDGQLRVKSKKEDFKENPAMREKVVQNTANMLHMLGTNGGHCILPIMEMSSKVDRQIEAEHGRGRSSSHNTQNN